MQMQWARQCDYELYILHSIAMFPLMREHALWDSFLDKGGWGTAVVMTTH